MPTAEITLTPLADLGPNECSAVGGTGSHASCVSTDDGDSSRLQYSNDGLVEVFSLDLATFPLGSRINSVLMRAVIKGASSGTSVVRVGFKRSGLTYLGAEINIPSDGAYVEYTQNYLVAPYTGEAFTWELLHATIGAPDPVGLVYMVDSAPSGVPRPAVSFVGFVATIPDPAAALSETEISEFWRLHAMLRRGEIYDTPTGDPRTALFCRYDYLRGRANANGQSLLPPRTEKQDPHKDAPLSMRDWRRWRR